MSSLSQRFLSFGLLLSGIALATHVAAAPSTQLTIGGNVGHPSVLGYADLNALSPITQTVSFLAGTSPQTHIYTGPSVWGVLNSAGIPTDPAIKNDILNRYVVATGSDGYRTVFSAGELSPSFGNRPDLIAVQETLGGVTAPIAADGFARITAPGDVKGGRYVSNLTNLDVHTSASTAAGAGGGVSTQFTVTGDVLRSKTFNLATLQGLATTTQPARGVNYTGVSFWDILSNVGLAINPSVKNDALGMYVVATGSDGYKSLFSLGELSPDFGNQPDMIAFAADGSLLTGNGFARVVVPNDVAAGRYVSNLVSLEVFHAVSAVPEPASMMLMVVGLAVLGWRSSRAARGTAARSERKLALPGATRSATSRRRSTAASNAVRAASTSSTRAQTKSSAPART